MPAEEPPCIAAVLFSSLLQLKLFLYPIHVGTFKFNTLAFAPPPPAAFALLRRVSGDSFLGPFSEWRTTGSDPFPPEPPPRLTCQTGLLRPKWTPARPGLLGHFLDLDSPAELLREHGALFTFLDPGAPNIVLGRVQALPADLLREKGHMLMFNSAAEEVAPPPLFLSFFFSF